MSNHDSFLIVVPVLLSAVLNFILANYNARVQQAKLEAIFTQQLSLLDADVKVLKATYLPRSEQERNEVMRSEIERTKTQMLEAKLSNLEETIRGLRHDVRNVEQRLIDKATNG